eukprot:267721-Amphidinium_carterae.1
MCLQGIAKRSSCQPPILRQMLSFVFVGQISQRFCFAQEAAGACEVGPGEAIYVPGGWGVLAA